MAVTGIPLPGPAVAKADVPDAKATESPLITPVNVPVIVAAVVPSKFLAATAASGIVKVAAVILAVALGCVIE